METPMQEQNRGATPHLVVVWAAELLLKCAGYIDDLEAASREDKEHRDIYYAIDADIISLYLQPIQRSDYLVLFGQGPTSSTAKSLAFLLGDFLFKSRVPLVPGHDRQGCRYLLIPPHDEELLSQLSAINRKILVSPDSIDKNMFENLTLIFEEYEKSNNDQILLNSLKSSVPDLVELFNPYRGPMAALERYAMLPETTIQRIDTYLENGFAFPILDPINDSHDRRIADALIEQWELQFRKHKRPRKPRYAIRNDAEVLASLEYINSNLQDQGKQLVLITGSSQLFKASQNYFLPWQTDGRSFSDMYLRHPQAFLAHERFFLPHGAEEASFKLIDWLNIFFPNGLLPAMLPQGIVDRRFVRRILRNDPRLKLDRVIDFLSNSGKDPLHLLDEWKTQVESIAKIKYSDGLEKAEERGIEKLVNIVHELRDKKDWSLDKLRGMIFKESMFSISTLYSRTIWVGLWCMISRVETAGIPALRFDKSYKEVEKYCERVVQLQLATIKNKHQISRDELNELRKLNTLVEERDPSFYLAHVIHALAFAVKGHWYATLTLAKTAMKICDEIEPAKRGVTRGREAAYIACIAARRSVKSRVGLKDAEKYLDEAIRREDDGAPEDIRFAAERLQIEAKSYYFDLFCDRKSLDNEAVTATLTALRRIVDKTKNEQNNRVRLWVLRQSLTTYFTLLLIAHDLQWVVNSPDLGNIWEDLEVFESVLEDYERNDFGRDDDPYATLICDVATTVWSPNPEKRESARGVASEAIDKWSADFMPYDKERLGLLKRVISKTGTQT